MITRGGNKYQWISTRENDKRKDYTHLDNGAFVYKHIYLDEFEQEFNIQPLYYTVVDPLVEELLDKQNLSARLNNVTDIDRNFIAERFMKSKEYSPYLKDLKEKVERGDRNIDDGRVYIRWVNDHVRYGMFAGKDFEKNDIIGLYTGYITKNISDYEYAWEYNYIVNVLDENNAKVGVCIDAKYRGNYMRFANHRDNNPNGDQFYTIYDDKWHVLYIAQTSIKVDQGLKNLLTTYNILVAAEASTISFNAINYAFDLCSQLSKPYSLKIIYIIALNPETHVPFLCNLDKANNIDILSDAKETINKLKDYLKIFDKTMPKVKYEFIEYEEHGTVGEIIKEYINKKEPNLDALIIGSRNLDGSTSDYLVKNIKCPVTIVKS
ncbi:11106_t:CDS:10 [Entrophospora sp. SA101]|nr:11106_t:CDS:10 [Entrophospora sp. SA101]